MILRVSTRARAAGRGYWRRWRRLAARLISRPSLYFMVSSSRCIGGIMRRHIHAMYQGFEALIAIESGKVIGGKLPPNALRMVRQWVLLRKRQLLENWRRGRIREPFQVVPGPDEHE